MTRPPTLTTNQAAELVGHLVSLTTGWNDDSVDAMMDKIVGTWNDWECALAAVGHIAEVHDAPSRPVWAEVHGAYKAFIRRRNAERPAITPGGNTVPFARGREIAAEAYRSVARARPADDPLVLAGYRKCEPDERFLAAFLGSVKSK